MLCDALTAPRAAQVVDLFEHAYELGPQRRDPLKRIVGLAGPSDDARATVAGLLAERAGTFTHRFLDAPRRLTVELLGGQGAVDAAGLGPIPGAGTYRWLRALEEALSTLAQRLTAPGALGVARAADVAAMLTELHGAVEAAGAGLTVDLLVRYVATTGTRLDGALWTRLALARAERVRRNVVLADAVHPTQVAAINATPRGLCVFVEPPGFDGVSPMTQACALRVVVTPDDDRATEAEVERVIEALR